MLFGCCHPDLSSPSQIALISTVLPQGDVGPYQLQAAMAAVHDEAKTMADTDWPQILGLYDLLELAAPNPFTALNRAVAADYLDAARRATSLPERRYLALQAARLTRDGTA